MNRPDPQFTPELVDGLLERAGRPDFDRFCEQLRSSGYCARPIRLQGEVRICAGQRVWSTDDELDGVLRKACGNRREAVCPSCAETYRADAYQLISAGLRGGKGVPDSVSPPPSPVRDPDGAELRCGAHPSTRLRGPSPALPTAPRRAPLPARASARLQPAPRR